MKVLVTGYGGFLGSEISRQLLAEGHEVRGFSRQKHATLVDYGVEAATGDLRDNPSVLAACQGVDAIIHTAAIPGVWGDWQTYFGINTLGTQNLVAAARQAGVRALVYSSSPSVTFGGKSQSGIDESARYPQRWLCHYPHSKALAEQHVLASNGVTVRGNLVGTDGMLLTCSLRPHLIWGANDPHLFPRLLQRRRQNRLIQVGSGKNLIDTVHVTAAARAHLLALERLLNADVNVAGRSFFVTDGQPVNCWDWIGKVLETAGLKRPTKHISFRTAWQLGGMMEVAWRVGRRKTEPPMTRFVAAQLALDHYFNVDAATEALGFHSDIDRDAELQKLAPWLLQLASGATVAS